MESIIPGSLWHHEMPGLYSTTLRNFDVYKPITTQADTSQKGVGATLLQDSHLVTFSPVALTPVEQCYANMEQEMFASAFDVEQFYIYIFGLAFTVETDHKPLQQIKLKNLAHAQKKTEFQAAAKNDPPLHSLADTIHTGLQEDIDDVWHPLCPYHAHHNVLTVEDGIILHGKAPIILPTEREKLLQAIDEGHIV